MNCLEFRKILLQEPNYKNKEFLRHADECRACSREYQRAQKLEKQIQQALEVKVPESLRHKILLDNQLQQRNRKRSRLLPIAMAASVLMAIGLGINSFRLTPDRESLTLSQSVLTHVQDEAHHLHEINPVSNRQLQQLFYGIGTRLTGRIGKVNFASNCQMIRHNGLHLVIAGTRGPITLLVMPKEHINNRLSMSNDRFNAVIIPTDYGSLAIIGERNEDLQSVSSRVASNIVVF